MEFNSKYETDFERIKYLYKLGSSPKKILEVLKLSGDEKSLKAYIEAKCKSKDLPSKEDLEITKTTIRFNIEQLEELDEKAKLYCTSRETYIKNCLFDYNYLLSKRRERIISSTQGMGFDYYDLFEGSKVKNTDNLPKYEIANYFKNKLTSPLLSQEFKDEVFLNYFAYFLNNYKYYADSLKYTKDYSGINKHIKQTVLFNSRMEIIVRHDHCQVRNVIEIYEIIFVNNKDVSYPTFNRNIYEV